MKSDNLVLFLPTGKYWGILWDYFCRNGNDDYIPDREIIDEWWGIYKE
jgi:hypothetical protein